MLPSATPPIPAPRSLHRSPWSPTTLALAAATVLAGCGGSDDTTPLATTQAAAPVAAAPASAPAAAPAAPPAAAPAPSGLSGSVAVGAPLTGATVRVIDATGQVVAENVAVAADGSYTVPTLGGTGPYRLEACGYAGPNYQCLYSVVSAGGTAHVTPLTTAVAMLASGRAAGELMSGSAATIAADALSTAQTQLRTALAPVLDGNVPAAFDFTTGALQAGSRTGYDRVLDAIGVSTGVDGRPFVQITPRLGSGNLYLESGSAASGQISSATGAASLDLTGLDRLFSGINAAIATAQTCRSSTQGLASVVASDARFTMGSMVLEGRQALAEGFCQLFEEEGLLGARFLSPVLGRCDVTRAMPVCRVNFGLQFAGSTEVQSLGVALGVTYDSGTWYLRGDADDVPIHVSTKVQRSQRVDGDNAVVSYERALAIEVPALPGLACARASQRNAAGERVTLALLKPMTGVAELERLSVWRPGAQSGGDSVSLDPAVGNLRNQDDTWLMLPEGDAGDAVARNFFRGGRTVDVALFADAACSAPFTVAGRSQFEVEINGAPPVWASMPSLPWPELTSAARATLTSWSLPTGATGSLPMAWTYPRGTAGLGEVTLCVGEASQCGQGGPGRLLQILVRGGATAATLEVPSRGVAVTEGGHKALMLYGHLADGTGMQANFQSCSSRSAGTGCY